MSPTLAGMCAWVTGGRRGLGRAFAARLVAEGAEVVVTTRDPQAAAAQTGLRALEEIAVATGAPMPRLVPWDLEAADAATTLATQMKTSSPDLVVHAAHVFTPHAPFIAVKPEDFSRSLTVNVGGAYAVCRTAGRLMARKRFGRILLLGSLASTIGGAGQVRYITEKAAFEGLARAFAAELGDRNVAVNVVHPGIVATENVLENVAAPVREGFARATHLGRLLTPEEVVLASWPFLDPRVAALNGQVLRISGGVDSGAALHRVGSRSSS